MSVLRNTRYIDRRTGSNIVKMGIELSDIAGRLKLFGFDEEAGRLLLLAVQLTEAGEQLKVKLGDRRLRYGINEEDERPEFQGQ